MKLTKQQLKQLIKEELRTVLQEQTRGAGAAWPQPPSGKPFDAIGNLEKRIRLIEDCLYRKKCPPPAGAPTKPATLKRPSDVLEIESF